MAFTSFKKELWETAILQSFKDISVVDLLAVKPSSVSGSTAHFNTASLTTGVQDYSGSVTWEGVNTAGIDLPYNKKKYFAFAVDDVDKVQLAGDVMLPLAQDQAEAFKAAIDTDFFAEAKTGVTSGNVIGATGSKKAITTASQAYDYIVDLGTKLDEKKVPSAGRYVCARPEFVNLLAKDTRVINNSVVLPNGVVQGMNINGMQIIRTMNVPANVVLAISNKAVGYGKQIDEVEPMRLQTAFSDGIRGLVQYGVKTLRGDAIAMLWYSIS